MRGRVTLAAALCLAFVIVAVALVAPPVRSLGVATLAFGEPESGAFVELYTPEGEGPFPAVVVLHPCNGVAPNTRLWAERLRRWGYLAAVVDSFGPRGVSNLCGDGSVVPAEARARDAFAAAAMLSARRDVRRDRIGVFGLSHGAGGVIEAATKGAGEPAFRAAVAVYPWCPWRTVDLQTATLILIGEADDWTPAARCIAFVEHEKAASQPISLKTYPGALHAFDNGSPVTMYLGHRIGSDPDATADAVARTRDFFSTHLR